MELHGVRGATLGARTQVSSVAEHIGQRYLRIDHVAAALLLHPLDLAAAGRKVSNDVAHVVVRRGDGHGHYRLEEDRARRPQGFFDRQ